MIFSYIPLIMQLSYCSVLSLYHLFYSLLSYGFESWCIFITSEPNDFSSANIPPVESPKFCLNICPFQKSVSLVFHSVSINWSECKKDPPLPDLMTANLGSQIPKPNLMIYSSSFLSNVIKPDQYGMICLSGRFTRDQSNIL